LLVAEYVVFITPTALQLAMFDKMLRADRLDEIEGGTTAESLALIGHLTKLSSSPILLKAVVDSARQKTSPHGRAMEEAAALLPVGAQAEDVSLSGQ
jgi:DNA repair and recombination protein RAD54B